MLKGQRLTILLAPTRLEVALHTGGAQPAVTSCEVLNPADWASTWEDGLLPLDASLEKALRATHAPKCCSAEVIYAGSSEVVDLRSYDSTTEQPLRMAQASLIAELAFDREQAVTDGAVLRTPAGSEHQIILTAADKDDRLRILFAWLVRAGLKPQRAVPLEAVLLDRVVRESFERGLEQCGSLLYLGEHATVLLSMAPDADGHPQLRFVRSFRFGFDAFSEAIARAIAREHCVGQDGPIDLAHARALLIQHGIPSPDQLVDPVRSMLGRTVLPLMQPVLQRYVIECRQTLRFGFHAARCPGMTAIGCGARIPGLIQTLSNFLDIDIQAGEHARGRPLPQLSDPGEMPALVADPARPVSLMPRSQAVLRETRRLSLALRVGAVAACGVLAWSTLDAWNTHKGIQQQIMAFRPQVDRVRQVVELENASGALARLVGNAEHSMYATLDATPDWGGLLSELGFLCDARVRLLALNSSTKEGVPELELHGIAIEQHGEEKSGMSVFLERLAYSPLFRDVRLESTRRTVHEGQAVRRFVIRATAVSIPAGFMAGESHKPAKRGGS